jgi:PAS domain S-box-containing protein
MTGFIVSAARDDDVLADKSATRGSARKSHGIELATRRLGGRSSGASQSCCRLVKRGGIIGADRVVRSAIRRTERGLRSQGESGLIVDPLDVIARSGAAAFATDEKGRITIWNKEAEELLGYPSSHVLGKPCHEILCGTDVFGNRYCDRQCPLTCMVDRHEQVRHFELDVRADSGEMIPASFSIVVLPGPRGRQYTLIHFLETVDRQREASALIRRILTEQHAPSVSGPAIGDAAPAASPALTARELQILRMLAEGKSTQGIADSLFISVTTTRNHIQNILRKFDVHSKLEAVSLALRTHLL